MTLNSKTILHYLQQNKSLLAKEYAIEKLALFGSFARDEAGENSDIDIVFMPSGKQLPWTKRFELEHKLEQHFNRKVDLVNYNYMNPLVRYKSAKEMIYV